MKLIDAIKIVLDMARTQFHHLTETASAAEYDYAMHDRRVDALNKVQDFASNHLEDDFDAAVDDATHAVIASFEPPHANIKGFRLPEGDDLSDLMVRLNDAITALMEEYKS